MYKSNSISVLATAIIAALLLFVPAVLLTQQASAHDDAQVVAVDGDTGEESNTEESTASGEYKFVAQVDDSYSKIARKSIQIYGIDNKVDLSPEQIVFAETNLTKEAGSPYLNTGQAITVSKESVKSWVEKAKALTKEQQAPWTPYTVNVDFNTNNVGE